MRLHGRLGAPGRLSAKSSPIAAASPTFAGGNIYPSLIRKNPAKPLRVFLQTGTKDLDIVFGNWPIANQDMASALAYKGYDYRFVLGEGGHSLVHGGSIFPDTMRWLWRDYPR